MARSLKGAPEAENHPVTEAASGGPGPRPLACLIRVMVGQMAAKRCWWPFIKKPFKMYVKEDRNETSAIGQRGAVVSQEVRAHACQTR